MLVKNWMSRKVFTIDAGESMQSAIHKMQEKKIKLLPVLSREKLVGIVSDRDLKKASPSDASTLDIHELLYLVSRITIKDLMIKKVVTVPPDYTIEEAAEVLLENRISGLPVMDRKDRLIGIITRSDIFKTLISITGLGKKGIQVAIRIKDIPGPIKEIRELIRKYSGRTAGILTCTENAPTGYLHTYFRIYNIPRDNVSSLLKEMESVGTLLYIVDHRDNKRTVFDNAS